MAARVMTVLMLGFLVGPSAVVAEGGFTTAELAEKNKQEGQAFLSVNKDQAGVIALKSGLQYKVLKAGEGAKPTIDDSVVAHYRGFLIDGTEFDSSYKRNRSATFRVNRVIKGWTEALQLMSVGSTWRIFVPSDLAYGARGARRTVGPNSVLIFEVELLSIEGSSDNDSRATAARAISDIRFSYKLDPRLTRGLYMGDRWVSRRIHTGVGGQDSVEARAQGVDVAGHPMIISPRWTPSDPDMVSVMPSEGNEVQIRVKRAGRSRLQVSVEGMAKELVISATHSGGVLRLEIAQES